MTYETVTDCRLCGVDGLEQVLDLGVQPLSGVFPLPGESVSEGPLRLVRCAACDLVQLGENFEPSLLYGENYGYRSGLNLSMVEHLKDVARYCDRVAGLQAGDLVLDIGSNDGTLLGGYETEGLIKWGVDPTAAKFYRHYPQDANIVPTFFSAEAMAGHLKGRKARVVTSIACLYDLQRPVEFIADILEILADDGIWVTEQSYFLSMIGSHAYDTICHEHLEYYRLADIAFMAKLYGLKILHVETNGVNGGSFMVILCRDGAEYVGNTKRVQDLLTAEGALLPDDPLSAMAAWLPKHRDEVLSCLAGLKRDGKTVYGYGASTKGNVLLNYCGIGPDLLPAVAEVNEDKFGRVTPGTGIPIIPEAEAREKADAFFVLPWHFKDMIVKKEEGFFQRGGKLIFPLPELEVVG